MSMPSTRARRLLGAAVAVAAAGGATLAVAAPRAHSTATTGPCEVGVELRAFPQDAPDRYVGYASYVCPADATEIQVTYQLFHKDPSTGRTNLTPVSAPQAVPDAAQDTAVVAPTFSVPASEVQGYSSYQLDTHSTYVVGGQRYTQEVVSTKSTVTR